MKSNSIFLQLWALPFACMVAFLPVTAQVNINNLGTPYIQDFNTLGNAGTGIIWIDNSTISGWYSNKGVYDADSGWSGVDGLFSYGWTPSPDRALGGSASIIQWVGFAVKMVNKTGTGITSFDISYIGEQWRCANTLQQLLDFQYKINASGITDVSWIDVNQLDFISPQTCPDTNWRDGNQPLNRANLSFTLNVTLNNNDTIWFRWVDNDDTNADHGLGIDDLSITANGCALTTSNSITNVSCNGLCNGAITTNPTGGTAPYTYNWSNGMLTQTINSLCAGTYTVTVTDNTGCTATASSTVTQPTALGTSNSVTNLNCNGVCTGSITTNSTGGTPPYSYNWSNAMTTSTINSLCSGTYTVTVTDNKGCTVTSASTITQPAALITTNSVTNVTCNGLCNGSIITNSSGGTAPYTYAWSGGGTASSKTSLCAGTYTVTVTDNKGCTTTATSTITQPSTLITINSVNNLTCNGVCTGSITTTPSGGTAAYTYSWSNGMTTATITGLCTATYTITITDSYGCTATASSTVTQPAVLVASAGLDVTICQGTPGAIGGSPTATGGISPYTYSWNTSAGLDDSTFANPSANPSSSTLYVVSVVDNNSCVKSDTLWVIVNNPATASAGTDATICEGSTYTLSGSRGGSATSSTWSTSGTGSFDNSTLLAATYTPSGADIAAGSVTLTITTNDPAGPCSAATDAMTLTINSAATVSANINATICQGSIYTLSGSRGGSATSSTWTTSGTGTFDNATILAPTYTPSAGDVSAGSVTLTITTNDPAGPCPAASNAMLLTINQAATAGAGIDTTICEGSTYSLSGSRGGSATSSTWTTSGSGSFDNSALLNAVYTPSAGDISSGSVTLTLTTNDPDGAGPCTTASDALILTINSLSISPSSISASVNPVCLGGSATLNVVGGSLGTGANWFWYSGACGGTFEGTGAAIIVSPASNKIYYVRAEGTCNATACGPSLVITVDILPTANAGTDGTVCDTNGYSLSASFGGSASWAMWSSSGTGVFDNSFSPIAIYTPSAGDVSTGTVTLSFTTDDPPDACPSAASDTMILTINSAAAANAGSDAAICEGSTHILSGTRGGSAISSTWTTSGSGTFDDVSILAAIYTPSGADIAAGSITITLTTDDPAGTCTAASDLMILTINQAATVSAGSDNTICQDSTITLLGSRGGSATSSTWTTSGTGTFNDASLLTAVYTPSGADVSAGSVTLSITTNDPDGGGPCTAASDAMALTIDAASVNPAGASASVNPVCTGNMTTLTVSGGSLGSGSGWVWYSGSCGGTPVGTGPSLNVWPTVTTTYFVRAEGPCNFTSCASVVVNVNQMPTTPNAGPDQDLCNLTSTTLAGNIPAIGTGIWELLSGVATIVTPSSPTSLVTGLLPDTSVLLRWAISNGACVAINDNMYINTYSPATANSGGDAYICSSDFYTLSGSIGGSATTSAWTTSGTGSFDNANLLTAKYIPSASDISAGSVALILTTDDPTGPCVAASDTMILYINPNPTVTTSKTNVSCNGGSDGTATANPSGGTSPYSYLWDDPAPAQNTQTATGLSIGTFNVTVTDAKGCITTGATSVNEPAAIFLITGSVNSTCGSTDGQASVSATGGIPPYIFNWSSGCLTDTCNGLAAGSYQVTVTDANSCTTTSNATVNNTGGPTVSIPSFTNVSCFGLCDGTATASASGGTPPITYSWSNGQLTATATGLCAGTYTITVTDNKGCIATNSATINEPPLITLSITIVDVACNGGNNGNINLTVTGGIPPYIYVWSNTETTEDISGLVAGVYSITVEDANGCTADTSGTVNEPAALSAGATDTDISCFGYNDGTATVTVSGGVSPYSYNWSNGETTAIIDSLSPAIYDVMVTDANGCTVVPLTTVSEPLQLSCVTSVSDATCYGCSDGNATATPSGGIVPYSYLWNTVPVQNSTTATGLIAGNYDVTVTDANGCTATANAIITEPPSVNVVATVNVTGATCYGACNGTADASATGGTLPYTYIWSTGSTSNNINGLCAGSYSVIVQDATADADTVSFGISEPAVLTAAVSGTNVSSCGMQDGSADLTASGGTTPYSYSWSNGSITEDLLNINSGYYFVVVTDANGCTATSAATITEPAAITLSAVATDASSCNASDGSVDLTVNGGLGPFTFIWSNGATTEDVSGVPAGNHSVTVIDLNGCQASASATVNEPPAFSLSFSSASVKCSQNCDGSILVSPVGGVAPFTYLWSDVMHQAADLATGLCSGNYNVTVTDANNCIVAGTASVTAPSSLSLTVTGTDATFCGAGDGTATVSVSGGVPPYEFSWSDGSTTSLVTNLPGGIHYITVRDSNDCVEYGTVTINDNGGPVISVTSVTDVVCANAPSGAINISVSSGLPPYTYLWSTGQVNEDISGLQGGVYDVEVADASGCKATKSITVNSPLPLITTVNTVNSSCGNMDGSASVSVSGGVSPYVYFWSVYSTSSSVNGLGSGTYYVTVTDYNWCTKSAIAVVSDNGGPIISRDSIEHIGCGDSLTGAIYVTISGGLSPYNLLWSNGTTTDDIVNVATGTYTLVVGDGNGCSSVFTDSVQQDPPLPDPICMVTVDSATGYNLIVWTKAGLHIAYYNIYREMGNSGNFVQIGTVPYSDESQFLDTISNPNAKSWRYKLGVVDSCGNESEFLAPMHKTMFLILYQAGPGIVLVWDPYYGYYFNDIVIFRGTAPDSLFPIDTIPAGGNSYFDWNPPSSVQVYYLIAAIHPTGCTALKLKTYNASKSNTASMQAPTRQEELRMAECQNCGLRIMPNPANDKLTILFNNAGMEKYQVEIFDMMGRKLYRSLLDGMKKTEINVNGWSEGIYHVKVISETEVIKRKLVISR